MKKINRKGFTMIELLAVITLLGIIMVVAIPNVSRLIQKSKDSKRSSNESTLLMATKSYLQANRDKYPRLDGEVVSVDAIELKDNGFLKEDITDGNKASCMDRSYVNVQKNGDNKYDYTTWLLCPGDKDPVATEEVPEIKIKFYYYDENGDLQESMNEGIDDEDKQLTRKVTIEYTGGKYTDEDGNEKEINLAGCNYTVLVSYDENGVAGSFREAVPTVPLQVNRKTDYTKAVELDLSKHIDVTRKYYIRVIARAYNVNGGYGYGFKQSIYNNTNGPVCGDVVIYDNKGKKIGNSNITNWVNTPRTVTVECKDKSDAKCKKSKFTQTFTKTGDIGNSGEVDDSGKGIVYIEDNKGKFEPCVVDVYLDTEAPTIDDTGLFKWKNNTTRPTSKNGLETYSGYKTNGDKNWSKSYIYTEPGAVTEKGSGLSHYKYTATGITGNLKELNDVNNNVDKDKAYRNFDEDGVFKIKWKACDVAGNCSKYSKDEDIFIYSGTTKPARPVMLLYKWNGLGDMKDAMKESNLYTPGTWTDKYIVAKYEHEVADIFEFTYQYRKQYTAVSSGGGTQNAPSNPFDIRDEGSTKWNFIVKDMLDNISYNANVVNGKSNSDAVSIKIDTTPPTITKFTVSSAESGYNSNYINITLEGNDGTGNTAGIGFNNSPKGKACIQTSSNVNNCTWINFDGMESSATSGYGNVKIYNALNGSNLTIYAWIKDGLGHVSEAKTVSYKLYNTCSEIKDDGYTCGAYDECHSNGYQYATKTITQRDKHTGAYCGTRTEGQCSQTCTPECTGDRAVPDYSSSSCGSFGACVNGVKKAPKNVPVWDSKSRAYCGSITDGYCELSCGTCSDATPEYCQSWYLCESGATIVHMSKVANGKRVLNCSQIGKGEQGDLYLQRGTELKMINRSDYQHPDGKGGYVYLHKVAYGGSIYFVRDVCMAQDTVTNCSAVCPG